VRLVRKAMPVHNMRQAIWQAERLGVSSRAEKIVRDLSHASVLVFVVAAVVTGILASILLSSNFGLSMTASFIVVAFLFPLLSGWLWKERWRAKKLEERLRRQQGDFELAKATARSGDDPPPGLLILSPDLRVCFANQTYFQTTLQTPEEVLGAKIRDVLASEVIEVFAQALFGHPNPAASCHLGVRMRLGLAGERPVRITMARFAPDHEDRVLMVIEDLFQGCSQSDLRSERYVC
jgi:PAS domain-containing protein